MNDPEYGGLREFVDRAEPRVRQLAANLALERAKAQQASMIALDQKTSQVAALQAAAAAIAATIAGEHAPSVVSWLAAAGAVLFLIGTLLAIIAALPRNIHAPGPDLSHWVYDYPQASNEKDAQLSVLNLLQIQMTGNLRIARRRSRILWTSLLIGALGSAPVAGAAVWKALPHPSIDDKRPVGLTVEDFSKSSVILIVK